MKLNSLGYRTDLIFHAFDAEIIDRGDHLAIRTPSNPGFYWGNFLLFSQPPQEGDFTRWRDLFTREIGAPPETQHQVFGWDSPEGEEGVVQPFLQAGFRIGREVVLTSSEPSRPSRPSDLVNIRPLQSGTDWEQAVENQVVCRQPEFEEDEYRDYREQQMDRYQNIVAAGLGDWYGAFVDHRLVADLGLFHDQGLARYQTVQTHPDFRRQGIAGTLVYSAGRQSMENYGLHTLVIVADQASNAARLYESLGFKITEKQVGLEMWPNMDLDTNDGG